MNQSPCDKDWFDRKGSREEFMSLSPGTMYITRYFQELANDTIGMKLGIAAATAVLTALYEAYGELFFVVIALWLTDMIFGSLRALRDPNIGWKWSKSMDGIIRLIIICVLPAVARLVELAPAEIFNIDPDMKFVGFVLSVMAVNEFLSVLDNASYLYPALEKVRARVVTWNPEKEVIEDRNVTVAIFKEKDGK